VGSLPESHSRGRRHPIRLTEAAVAGVYENDFWKKKYPRIQIITVLDLLNGKRPDMPWGGSPFAKAPVERERGETGRLV